MVVTCAERHATKNIEFLELLYTVFLSFKLLQFFDALLLTFMHTERREAIKVIYYSMLR